MVPLEGLATFLVIIGFVVAELVLLVFLIIQIHIVLLFYQI